MPALCQLCLWLSVRRVQKQRKLCDKQHTDATQEWQWAATTVLFRAQRRDEVPYVLEFNSDSLSERSR